MKKSVINDKNGGAYVKASVIILCIMMLFCAILFFFESYSLAVNIKKRIKLSLDSYVIQKSIDAYQAIDDGEDYITLTDNDSFYQLLSIQFSNLDKSVNASGCQVFVAKDNSYSFTKPVITTTKEGRIRLYADFSVIIPVHFAGEHIFDMTLPMRVSSMLTKIS